MTPVIEHIANGFGVDPVSIMAPPAMAGGAPMVSAALWSKPAATTQRVHTPPLDVGILSVHIDRQFQMDFQIDAEDVFRGYTGPGDVCFVPPGTRPEADLLGHTSVLHIYVPQVQLGDIGLGPGQAVPYFGHAKGRHGAITALVDACQDGPPSGLTAWAAYGRLVDFTLALASTLRPANTSERLTPFQLGRIRDHLQTHFEDALRVADLAALLDLSEAHFARAFRNSTGKTPGQALRDTRMQAARDLLLASHAPIGDIAAECGYPDPSFFARTFKDLHGATPAKWRRQRTQGDLRP